MTENNKHQNNPEASPLLWRGRGRSIAIYGGTFNPPHIGHTSLAKSLIEQGLADEVWLLVSPLNPFKQANTQEFAPYEDRLRMTELAVQDIPGLRASDFENHLPVPSYMITTLNELSRTYPQHRFILVIGADNWQRFDHWYHSEEIKQKYDILIYRRPGYDITNDIPNADSPTIRLVDTPLFDISSTQIRNDIRQGLRPTQWLSPQVLDYIVANDLYKDTNPVSTPTEYISLAELEQNSMTVAESEERLTRLIHSHYT